MSKHVAIGERLRKAGTLAVKRDVAHDWAAGWRRDHDDLIRRLERLIGVGDATGAGQLLGQLKGMHDKRFGAIGRVIDALSDEDTV